MEWYKIGIKNLEKSVDEAWNQLKKECNKAVEQHVPLS